MKHAALLCAMLFQLTSIFAVAEFHNPGPSQRFQSATTWSGRKNKLRNVTAAPAGRSHASSMLSRATAAPALPERPRRNTAPSPTGKLGLLVATQIPAGGGIYNGSTYLNGDFNGDGKQDLAVMVNTNASSPAFSISVSLGNGDGTFQAPVMTPVPQNDSCAQFMVGDLNGDHKEDIIVVHQAGCTSIGISVLLSNGDGTFSLGNTYNFSGTNFYGGALVDVNSDSKLDFVAVDQSSPGNVWTLLGNGDGTFQAPTSVALSTHAGYGALFADLNGDGLIDIAVLDGITNELTVFLATSPTTFAGPVPYNTQNSVFQGCSLTAGDLTGDGKPELVSANCASDSVTVYVNNGDGTFQTGSYYAVSTAVQDDELDPGAVAIADVNGDGKADLITTNMNSSDVSILLGNGDGTVNSPSIAYAVGGYPGNQALVADFNGDGFPDLVVSDFTASLVFLKGYGDGTFRAAIDYASPVSSGKPQGATIATGDFNGDGNPDFVMGNCCTSQAGITVFLSRSDGSLQTGVNYFTANSSQDLLFVAVADFNNDGKPDIAAADTANSAVQVFYGVGDGTFTLGPSYASGVSGDTPVGIIAADFNRDGFTDVAVANTNDGSQDVGILLNDGTGNLASVVTYDLSNNFNNIAGLAVGDLNKDGKLDIVAPLFYGSEVAVLFGNGDGTFQPEADVPFPVSNLVSATVADFNGDGNPDMAVLADVYAASQGLYVALGNGDGTFQPPVFYATTNVDQTFALPYAEYIQSADINGDGKLDLVYTNSNYGTVGILFGVGDGTFDSPVEYPVGQYAFGLAIADLNHDGTPDVVIGDDDFAGVTTVFNLNGSGTQSNYGLTTNTPSATIPAGGSAVFNLTITPANHYNGIVTMSCGSLPPFTTCSFNPPSFHMDGHTPVAVQLTVQTTAVTASLRLPPQPVPARPHNPIWLALLSAIGVAGTLSAGCRVNSSRSRALLLALILPAAGMLSSCGKDCDDNPSQCASTSQTAAATTASVTASLNPAVAGQPVTFTGTVSSAMGTPTGNVTFLDGSTQLGTATLSSGSANFQTSTLSTGTHSITVRYAGNSSFKASTSPVLSETIDHPGTPAGTYTIPINATGTAGTNSGNTGLHRLSVSITVR